MEEGDRLEIQELRKELLFKFKGYLLYNQEKPVLPIRSQDWKILFCPGEISLLFYSVLQMIR